MTNASDASRRRNPLPPLSASIPIIRSAKYAVNGWPMTLADRLRANATLLQMLLHSPGGALSKSDLHGLAADLLRHASEAEELQAMAGTAMEQAA